MKLHSLSVDQYHILKDFTIDFEKNISILIGINGSGKSSILEAIAHIFSCAVMGYKAKFAFKIVYELRLDEILERSATSGEFRTDYIAIEISSPKSGQELAYKVFVEDKVLEQREDIEKRFNKFEKIFPSNIVIYYSGLSEVMKTICEPHNQLLSREYREGKTNAERMFFYFEPQLFEIILVSLLAFEFGEIPDFLLKKAKIAHVNSIQLILRKPEWAKGKAEEWWGARGEVRAFLDYIDSISSDPSLLSGSGLLSNYKGNVVVEMTSNESIVITISGQQKLFEIREQVIEEKILFRILNAIYIDGFLANIKFSFENSEGNSVSHLSEGEQQAIITKGLTELVTNENTLFLFDEPDTYLHPSWQRSFIEEIIQFNESNTELVSQFLITTHSPQLLSNANPEKSEAKIIEDGEIIKVTPKYYGRDISTILYEIMGVERRNKKVAKLLSKLFNVIESGDLKEATSEYNDLSSLLGEDDPAIIRAKTQLDFLEQDINEANN